MKKQKILLLANESADVASARAVMQAEGCQIVTLDARDEQAVLRCVDQERPPLVLVDVHSLAREKETFLAPLRALLTRSQQAVAKTLMFDGLLIDPDAHLAYLNERPLKLTASEFRILELLVRNKKRVFPRAVIVEQISNGRKMVSDRTVDFQIVNLRRKLGAWASHIQTVHGVGYRAQTPDVL